MDVTVLHKCCQQFSRLLKETSGVLCPFVLALTIAELCSLFLRSFILLPYQIGLIFTRGYSRNRPQSAKAKKLGRGGAWLQIQTIISGSEHKIGYYFVDGYRGSTKSAYKFYRCW